MALNKKYTLFKDLGDGSVAPCAFFQSPAGCRNGEKCKFAHVISAPQKGAGMSSNDSVSSSDISSESEDESPPPIPVTTPLKVASKSIKQTTPKKKTVTNVPDDDLFAPPGLVPQKNLTPLNKTESNKKRKRKSQEPDPFANPKKHAVCTPVPVKETVLTQTPNSRKNVKIRDEVSSFRNLNLPVASFSTPTSGKADAKSEPTLQAAAPTPTKYPMPTSTPEGMIWKNAVVATRKNPKYKSDFDFDKVKDQQDEWRQGDSSEWVRARSFGAWCSKNPSAIAIDCEMCETRDTVTGKRNPKALCRLSVVNADNPEEVLIDTLVKPAWPVVDYRSKINGIKKEHLETVQFTLKHAQAFMMALCSSETVIIGHAVHNDLSSLQFEHYCNVDSAMLFSVKDEPTSTCSLKDLAMSVMKRDMPEVHDSVNDARVALLCIKAGYLETGGSPEPVVRSFPTKKSTSNTELFVHRIPKGCFPEHISKMFLAHTNVRPKDVPKIDFNSETGKTTVTFLSADHASVAFKTLEGESRPDKTGRLQKRVYLKSGGYICIRKMTLPKNLKPRA